MTTASDLPSLQWDQTRDLILHCATMADIPTSIMSWIIDNKAVMSIDDLIQLSLDEIVTL
jgi:hypothetical protein